MTRGSSSGTTRERLRRAWRADEGVSLVELLVTMMIFSVVIVLVFQGVIAVQRMTHETEGSAEALSQLRAGLATIDRQVRSGNVLYSPGNEPAVLPSCTGSGTSGSCMRVYTQANGEEKCVQWQVMEDPDNPASDLLRMRSWAINWQGGGQVSGWQTVARGLVHNPRVAPFSLRGGDTAYKSRLLAVTLIANDPIEAGRTVEVTSSLSGRNTNYGYDAGRCSPVPAG